MEIENQAEKASAEYLASMPSTSDYVLTRETSFTNNIGLSSEL